jgi:hypothetical protein
MANLVLDRYKIWVVESSDRLEAISGLIQRKWRSGKLVDDFWIDIQARAKYCSFHCQADTNLMLTTCWKTNCDDPEVLRFLRRNPNATPRECYVVAKQEEDLRKRKPNVFKVLTYKKEKDGKSTPKSGEVKECGKCGYESHRNGKCPAEGKTCAICKEVGHFRKCCKKATVNEVNTHGQEVAICNSVQFDKWSYGNECEARLSDDRWYPGYVVEQYSVNGVAICQVQVDAFPNKICKVATKDVVVLMSDGKPRRREGIDDDEEDRLR